MSELETTTTKPSGVKQLRTEVERLSEFVKKYAGHSKPCPFFMGYECECGFAEVAKEFGIDLERD